MTRHAINKYYFPLCIGVENEYVKFLQKELNELNFKNRNIENYIIQSGIFEIQTQRELLRLTGTDLIPTLEYFENIFKIKIAN